MKEMPINTPENPYKMDKEEIVRRRDLRESHLVFSIDPKGCEDVDDTLSIRFVHTHTLYQNLTFYLLQFKAADRTKVTYSLQGVGKWKS